MKNRMILHLFDDGGEGGSGAQGGNAGNGNGNQGNVGATYSYQQAEEIASARAQRAEQSALKSYFKQQGLTEEEAADAIKDFKAKREASKPDSSKIEQERDDYKTKYETVLNEGILRDKGVRADDMDYVMFNVKKLVDDKTDFKKAAEKYLKDHPKFTSAGSYRVTTSSKGSANGTGGSTNASINDAIRNAARR